MRLALDTNVIIDITRDVEDFALSPVKAISPADFLRKYPTLPK